MIYNRVKKTISDNKAIREAGGYVAIPWDLPRLSTVLPGIQRAKLIGVTASSKVGKSQLTDFLFLHQPYEFYLNNPNSNIKPRIFYFTLEMSKESKIMAVLSYKLYRDYGVNISPERLLSVFKDDILDDKVLEHINKYESFFEEFEERVTFIDNIRNPTGIYKYMVKYAEENGIWSMKEMDWEENGKIIKKHVKDYYIPNDPEELVIVVVDHISLLNVERIGGTQLTLHQAMSKFSSDYCLYMRDKLKYTIVLVQQQSAEQEKKEFYKGQNTIDKQKPTADGLADNKLVGRDLNLLIGLFAPYRYKELKYEGYDLTILKDNYRELSIILNRDGKANASVDLFFDGAVNYFRELPKPDDTKELYKVYQYCKNKE